MNFRPKKLNQTGFDHVIVIVVFVVLFALIGTYLLIASHAATTYVQLHIGSTSGACVNGTTLVKCSTSSKEQVWATLSGSNFRIQNQANPAQCLDDWNGKVGTTASNRVYMRVNACYSNDKNQEWNWSGHRLVNVASKGCINSLNGNESAGADLIIYTCNSQGNENFLETSVSTSSSSGGSSNSGAPSCSHTGNAGQDVANCALYQLAYWNSHSSQHTQIIDTAYCDGNGACENGEWCAGFVSYVYKKAGYPIGDVFLAYNFESLTSHFNFGSKAAVGSVQVDSGSGAGHVQIVVKTSPLEFVSGNYAGKVVETSDAGGTVYGYATYK